MIDCSLSLLNFSLLNFQTRISRTPLLKLSHL